MQLRKWFVLYFKYDKNIIKRKYCIERNEILYHRVGSNRRFHQKTSSSKQAAYLLGPLTLLLVWSFLSSCPLTHSTFSHKYAKLVRVSLIHYTRYSLEMSSVLLVALCCPKHVLYMDYSKTGGLMEITRSEVSWLSVGFSCYKHKKEH